MNLAALIAEYNNPATSRLDRDIIAGRIAQVVEERGLHLPPPAPEPVDPFLTDQIKRQVGRVAARLRDMADAIEREGSKVDEVPSPGRSSYVEAIANRVYSDLRNGMANVPFEALLTACVDADTARIENAARAARK